MTAAAKDTSTSSEARSLDAFAILKDLIGTAIITLLILTPIVALKTTMNQGVLFIEKRWVQAAIITALVVGGRLLLHLFVWNKKPEAAVATPSVTSVAKVPLSESMAKYVAPALLVIAIALPFVLHMFPSWDKRGIDFMITILIYIMLGWGLNIVVGLAGLLDLGYVAFYAVGAYAYALLSTVYLPLWFGPGVVPWAFYIVLPISGLLAAAWGVILGFPVLRLRGDYLAIVTLAFGEMIRLVLINWFSFTNGPQGINVPKATFFGLPFKDEPGGFAEFFGIPHDRIYSYIFLYYVILILALVTYFATNRLRRLPIGRAWEALREDEVACRSLGINTTTTKLTAFATGAMFGGFAGSFFAARQGFVSPESFVYLESAMILAIVVLGGLGSQIGIVFSAIVIMGAFELFREFGSMGTAIHDGLLWVLPDQVVAGIGSVFSGTFGALFSLLPDMWQSAMGEAMSGLDPIQFRMLAVGLAMVLMMRFRPRGLVTRRQPTVFLKEKKSISGDMVAEGHG
jgi:branched-chain amino acid transport system permease protein